MRQESTPFDSVLPSAWIGPRRRTHPSPFSPQRPKVALVTGALFDSHIATMLESSPDMLSISARALARVPLRVGTSILGGLERVDRLSEGFCPVFPGLAARVAGHQAALARLLSPLSLPDPEASRRAVWRHIEWIYDSLAGFGGRDFHTIWHDATDLQDVVSRNEPVLIVTAHVGNWLVAAEACTNRLGAIETVAGVQIRPVWDHSIRRHLAARNVVVHRPQIAYRQFRRRLSQGGTVVLHLDGTPSPVPVGPERRARAPLGVRAAARLIATTTPRVFGVVSRRTASDTYTLFVEDLADAGEAGLLDYLRKQVSIDPSSWLIFRADHLGGEVR